MLSPTRHVDVDGFPLRLLWSLVGAVGAGVLPGVTARHVPEGEVADKNPVPVLQRGGERLAVPLPDQRTVPVAHEGEGAVEAKDVLGFFGFDAQPAASHRHLQQTWERSQVRPRWAPLEPKESQTGSQRVSSGKSCQRRPWWDTLQAAADTPRDILGEDSGG